MEANHATRCCSDVHRLARFRKEKDAVPIDRLLLDRGSGCDQRRSAHRHKASKKETCAQPITPMLHCAHHASQHVVGSTPLATTTIAATAILSRLPKLSLPTHTYTSTFCIPCRLQSS